VDNLGSSWTLGWGMFPAILHELPHSIVQPAVRAQGAWRARGSVAMCDLIHNGVGIRDVAERNSFSKYLQSMVQTAYLKR
jgi:hypothetical protein